nr:PspA/IM30 family protein [Candidatus Obscuribacter sp.]
MLDRLVQVIKAAFNVLLGKVEDPQMMLEQSYNELQSNVISVRQAVAQAIATEKQLETQLQKNKDQAGTWQNRAGMAVQQNNDELARQALQRKQQYAQAAADLETQL